MRADLRAAALAWYNAMGVIQMMKRMILAILALLLAAPGGAGGIAGFHPDRWEKLHDSGEP